jgi:hypothetical protein
MRFPQLLLVLSTLAAACGGGGDESPDASSPDASDTLENGGFPTPTAVTKANQNIAGTWTELSDAEWGCLNTPSPDQPSTQAIALSGKIEDFQSGSGVGGVSITAFPSTGLMGNISSATSSSVSATRGNYEMTLPMIPSGTRVGFKLEADLYVRTYVLNEYLDPAQTTQTRNMDAVSESTMNALPAFVAVTRDPSKGVLIGTFRDCDGHEVSNAVVTVSSTSAQVAHLTGVTTFYFSAAGTSLPVRHNIAPVMNKDGQFLILDVPPQTSLAFVQIWGFKDAADLADGEMTLLSELATPIEANAIITGSFEPLRN